MSLTTPGKIRELQSKLYRKAKNEPGFRFYQLYDKVYREDTARAFRILKHAYELARANHGSPGVDGESFEAIESRGLEEWMKGLREELRNQTYKPQPVRRVMIPKARGRGATTGDPDDTGPSGASRSEIDHGTSGTDPYRGSGKRSWSRMLTGTGRGRVRRMRFGKWMNCCTKVYGCRGRGFVEVL